MDDSKDMSYFARALVAIARSQSAPNARLSVVLKYHAPGLLIPASGGDPIPWPASVDVQPRGGRYRTIASVEQKSPGDTVVRKSPKGVLVQGPRPPVFRVPVLYLGGPAMTLTETPQPGSLGLLIMLGAHHGPQFSDGAETVSVLPPSTARTSDAVFLPGIVVGAEAVKLPPSSAPGYEAAAQLGPRSVDSETIYLRRLLLGWALGGDDVRLGSESAARAAAGVGDTASVGPGLAAFAANVVSALSSLGVVIAPLTGNVAVLNSGSPNVKVT